MPIIEFSKDEKTIIVKKIQTYFRDELDQDIGSFDAQFLLDFFSEEIGVYFYNQGLHDARKVIEKRLDTISEAVSGLEKATNFRSGAY